MWSVLTLILSSIGSDRFEVGMNTTRLTSFWELRRLSNAFAVSSFVSEYGSSPA